MKWMRRSNNSVPLLRIPFTGSAAIGYHDLAFLGIERLNIPEVINSIMI